MNVEAFVTWLEAQGFQPIPREDRPVRFLGDPDKCVSLVHPGLQVWAHVSLFSRVGQPLVECTLHPGRLGATNVFTTLEPLAARLAVVLERASQGPAKVWSEKPKRSKPYDY